MTNHNYSVTPQRVSEGGWYSGVKLHMQELLKRCRERGDLISGVSFEKGLHTLLGQSSDLIRHFRKSSQQDYI